MVKPVMRLSLRYRIRERCSDIVLEFEFEKSLTGDEHSGAVRHHLDSCSCACANACADRCALSPAQDAANDCANYSTTPDAFSALLTASIACNIIVGRVERHDVSVYSDSGQLLCQLRAARNFA